MSPTFGRETVSDCSGAIYTNIIHHIQCSAPFGHHDLMKVASKVLKVKEKKQRGLFPLRGNLRLLVDDADAASAEFRRALEFARENGSWIFKRGAMRLEQTSFVVSTSRGAAVAGSDAVSAKNNFVLELGELDDSDVTSVYQVALGDYFAQFEVEVSMHVKRLIRASAVINRMHGSFSMHKNSNVINGLLRADKDCQDTEGELTGLLIHEIRRTYRNGGASRALGTTCF